MSDTATPYERKIGDFKYASEKFHTARRVLMAPHERDEVSKLGGAFHECGLGLREVEGSERLLAALDDDARRSIEVVRRTMNTDGIEPDNPNEGTWAARSRRLTESEKYDFANAVDDLATWFHDAFYQVHSR